MGPGASTPEELETMLEDAFVLRDRQALIELFADGAGSVARHGAGSGRRRRERAAARTKRRLALRDLGPVDWRPDLEGAAMTQQTQPTLDPVAVRSDEGEARWWFEALAVIKASGADTGGQMTIVEMTYPPDADTPLHLHHREDEAFWM